MEQRLSDHVLESTARDSRCTSASDSHRMEKLEYRLKTFTAQLRRNFAQEIALDARRFKNQVLKLVRRGLPPRPGRPNDPHLDAACRMIEQGKTVKQVLRIQVPNFDRLDTYGAYLAEKGLRAALARRIRITTPAKDTQRSSPPK